MSSFEKKWEPKEFLLGTDVRWTLIYDKIQRGEGISKTEYEYYKDKTKEVETAYSLGAQEALQRVEGEVKSINPYQTLSGFNGDV